MPHDNDGEPGRPPLALVTADNESEIRALAELAHDLIKGAGEPLAELDAAAKRAMPLVPTIAVSTIARVLQQAMRDRGVDIHENAVERALGIGPASDEAIAQLEFDIEKLVAEYAGAEAANKAARAAHKANIARLKMEIVECALSLSWIKDRNRRLSLARHLYWRSGDVFPAWAIFAGLVLDHLDLGFAEQANIRRAHVGLASAALKMIGPGYTVDCRTVGCDGVHHVRSRKELVGPGCAVLVFGEHCPKCAADAKARRALAAPR
jgi:hypothetical protein